MPQPRQARPLNPTRTAVFKTGEQAADDPFEFVMATDDVDRMGDIIDIGGVELAAFKSNPVALWNHDSASPIGTWDDVRQIGGQLRGRLKLAAAGTSSLIDRVRQLIEQRIIRAVSVGFKPLEMSALKETGGLRFSRSELLECSVVAVPANANALRIKGLAPDPLDAQIFSGTIPPRQAPSRAWGDPAAQPRAPTWSAPAGSGNRTMPKSIAEKIMAAQQRAIAIDDEVATIQADAESDNDREFTDDEATSIAALAEEKAGVVKSIESLTLIEKTLASRARPTSGAPQVFAAPKTDKPGDLLVKVAVARVLAHCRHTSVENILAERYRDDERVKAAHDFILKSATDIADTLTPGWAAELVREDTKAFLQDLEAVSVYAALAAMGMTIDFGTAGSVLIPRRTGTAGTMAGAFVGETGVIPVVQGQIGGASLYRYKLAAISTFSKELERTSTPQIEDFLRTEIRKDTVTLIDQKFLDNKAMVPGVRPAGILNGVTPVASSGNTPANIATDIKALLGPLVAANALDDPVIILNPIRLLGLSLLTTATGEFIYKADIAQNKIGMIPFISSTNVPAATVIALNADDFGTAFGVPEYDVSDTATLTMANADNTVPTQATADGTIITTGEVPVGGGIKVDGTPTGPATAGAGSVSMFQQWSVALRSVTPISWAMLRPGVVTALSGVAW